MKKKKEATDAKAVLFKRLYGVKPGTFKKMLSILQKEVDVTESPVNRPEKDQKEYYSGKKNGIR